MSYRADEMKATPEQLREVFRDVRENIAALEERLNNGWVPEEFDVQELLVRPEVFWAVDAVAMDTLASARLICTPTEPICPIAVDQKTQTVRERIDAGGKRAERLTPRAFRIVEFLVEAFPLRFEDGEALKVALIAAGKWSRKKVESPAKDLREACAESDIVARWAIRPTRPGRPARGSDHPPEFGVRDERDGPNHPLPEAAQAEEWA